MAPRPVVDQHEQSRWLAPWFAVWLLAIGTLLGVATRASAVTAAPSAHATADAPAPALVSNVSELRDEAARLVETDRSGATGVAPRATSSPPRGHGAGKRWSAHVALPVAAVRAPTRTALALHEAADCSWQRRDDEPIATARDDRTHAPRGPPFESIA